MFIEMSYIIYMDVTKNWHNNGVQWVFYCFVIYAPDALTIEEPDGWSAVNSVVWNASPGSALAIQNWTTYQAISLSFTIHIIPFNEVQYSAFNAICSLIP